jgi:uncharacterized membrane protein YeaQ/YmgE (transglycosylase-associated protein family)
MGIFSWIVLGLVAGYLAEYLIPGNGPGGIIVTLVLGLLGALLGGFIGTWIGFGDVTGFDLRSVLLAVLGAVFLLLSFRQLRRA